MKSMDARSSNEVQWLDLIRHQDISSNIGHQGDMPYCVVGGSTETYRHRTCICSCNSLIQPFPCKIDFSKMFFTHFVLRSIWCNKMDCQFIRRHWSHINPLPSAVLFCFLIPLLTYRKCQIFAPMDKSNTFDSKNWYDCCRWDGAYSSQLIIRYNTDLTHCGLMTPCCIRHLDQFWFK